MIGPVCHSNGIKGFGADNAEIMIIGIAPGKNEIKEGKPFIGRSGQLLDAILKGVGVQREDVYCTNLICWYNDEPSREEQLGCRERLDREIKTLGPKVVFLMGALTCEAFLGRKLGGKNGARGAAVWSDEYDCYLVPTYHPSAILHGLGDRTGRDDKGSLFIYDLYRDLKKAKRIVSWDKGAPLAEVNYTVLESKEQAQFVLDNMSRQRVVALDVETYNPNVDEIDVWGDKLLCLTIATSDYGYVFPFELMEDLGSLRWPECKWAFHNAQFDTQIFYKNTGIWLNVCEDTMLQSYSLDERSGIHRLKPLAREYLSAGWWEEARLKGKSRLQDLPPEVLHEYNAKDAIYTARLAELFYMWQVDDDVRTVYETILIPLVNCIKEIQYSGFKIDRRKHMEFAIDWGQKYLDLETHIQEMAYECGWSDRNINLQSPAQVSKLLYVIIGMPVFNNNPSTDMEHLNLLMGSHEIIEEIIKFRHLSRFYDTYITGLAKHFKEDGRVHAYVKIHGTRTGRLSYGNPPLQTIPQTYEKKGVETYLTRIREIFVPRNKNYSILEVDFGKGEIWMAQAHSGDKQMLDDLMSGDYHSTVAANVMKKPLERVTKADRLKMKHVTFGVMYGREAKALSKDIETSTLEAQMYIEGFFRRYTDYTRFYNNLQRIVKERGELVSVTRRKRRFFILGSDVRALKQGVNYPIQSALGDLDTICLIIIHNKIKEMRLRARVLLNVHDSLVFECHKDDLPAMQQMVHDVMTAVYWEGFPRVPVEMSVGDSWGTTKGFHDCMKPGDDGIQCDFIQQKSAVLV